MKFLTKYTAKYLSLITILMAIIAIVASSDCSWGFWNQPETPGCLK